MCTRKFSGVQYNLTLEHDEYNNLEIDSSENCLSGHVDDSEDQDNHVEINIDYSEQTKGKRVEENTPVLTDEQYNMLYAMFYPNGGPSVAEFPDEVVKALF